MVKPGPQFLDAMRRLGHTWRQGQHVLVTGPTGSGKTAITRHIVEQRVKRGGFVMTFVGKLGSDETISDDYKGWTRWEKWREPKATDNRVLLWPRTDRLKTVEEMRVLQRRVFEDALNRLVRVGRRTLQIDEGLYTCDPKFLNLSSHVAMAHQVGRSAGLTIVTLAQRPAHLPLVCYSSASHVFSGRLREDVDRKRLAELGGKESAKELAARISGMSFHEYLWIPVVTDAEPEVISLSR